MEMHSRVNQVLRMANPLESCNLGETVLPFCVGNLAENLETHKVLTQSCHQRIVEQAKTYIKDR